MPHFEHANQQYHQRMYGGIQGQVKGESREEMETRAMYKLQKGCAATSSENCTDAFVPHSNPPTPYFFFFCLVSLVIHCERSGGYQSHGCLLQTSKPGALVHPSAPIIISARPLRKPRTLEEKYLIFLFCKDQQPHKR